MNNIDWLIFDIYKELFPENVCTGNEEACESILRKVKIISEEIKDLKNELEDALFKIEKLEEELEEQLYEG